MEKDERPLEKLSPRRMAWIAGELVLVGTALIVGFVLMQLVASLIPWVE